MASHEPDMASHEPDEDLTVGRGHGVYRKDFLKLGAAGLGGAVLSGALPVAALAQGREREGKPERGGPPESSRGALMQEFTEAAREYYLPVGILVAMGYVNTRLQMPDPEESDYEKGDLHGWGSYGIMALVKNPSSNTLGEASQLTGIPEEELKTDRRSNILGGAALLAESQGSDSSATDGSATHSSVQPQALLDAAAGKGRGRSFEAVAGVGAGGLYAEQLEEALQNGFAEKVDGESIAVELGEVVF